MVPVAVVGAGHTASMRSMLRRFATTSAQDMEAWAAPICATIQDAHCGRFDGAALRALYGEDAVYFDAKGEQQLIWEVSEPQKVTTKSDDLRIRRYTIKVRGNKVNAPTPQQLVYDAYKLPLMDADGDKKSFAQPLVPANKQRADGVVECSAILFPTLKSTPRLMKIQWKGPTLKLLTAVPEDAPQPEAVRHRLCRDRVPTPQGVGKTPKQSLGSRTVPRSKTFS